MAKASFEDAERAPRKKRAIALAGGGPAAGLHIGALAALQRLGIHFDVWSLSCIGAWVGIYYHQCTDADRAASTYAFFETHAFRDTASYSGFPVNKAFAPNFEAYAQAWRDHAFDPQTWRDVFGFGAELPDVARGWREFMTNPGKWARAGDRNAHLLNNVLAVMPATRFMTSMAYLSGINGLSNIYYPDSSLLEQINIESLDLVDEPGIGGMSRAQLSRLVERYGNTGPGGLKPNPRSAPEIYHNAYRLKDDRRPGSEGKLQLFNNKWLEYRSGRRGIVRDYLPITAPSLCACSALPYIEQTVKIPNDDDSEYSEGALIDTVSFRNLVEDHPDLDEIWVCRIVDYQQVRLQRNLHDSLGNLCQQFAAEVGENDIALFKNHLRKSAGRVPRVVEIPLDVKTMVDYRWDHENLKIGFSEGEKAVEKLLALHPELGRSWKRPAAAAPVTAARPRRARSATA
jgi:predicted acylesterase/phospholipase RssA